MCNCGRQCPEDKCLSSLTFVIDGQWLVPRLNGVPLDPVALDSIVDNAETNTRLRLDVTGQRLVYESEAAAKDISPDDSISVQSIANLITLDDLSDVEYAVATDGDILSYDTTSGKWVSYTIPSGIITDSVGIDADGKLVKGGGSGPAPSPGETPVGGIIIWPAPVASLPSEFRECNGQALSRAVFPDLFALLGTRYGAGDGTTTFNLPNMQTRSVHGLSSTGTIDTQFQTVGQTGGAKTVALTSANNGPHSHSMNAAGNHAHSVNTQGAQALITAIGTGTWVTSGGNQQVRFVGLGTNATGSHTHSINSSGSGTPHNNLEPYITMPYAMRVV